MLIASLYGMRKDEAEKRGKELLKEFGLYERRNSKVKGFSKGMKQRLMFCMALINDPEIIFLDEPTSGLDVQSARMMRKKILGFKDKTVFLTSHNMGEVNTLCDEIAIINKGRIVAVDTPERIKQKVGGNIAVEVSFNKQVKMENAERHGDKYLIYTMDPHETISQVVEFARRNDVKIVLINTRTPTLEDAFLKLLEVRE